MQSLEASLSYHIFFSKLSKLLNCAYTLLLVHTLVSLNLKLNYKRGKESNKGILLLCPMSVSLTATFSCALLRPLQPTLYLWYGEVPRSTSSMSPVMMSPMCSPSNPQTHSGGLWDQSIWSKLHLTPQPNAEVLGCWNREQEGIPQSHTWKERSPLELDPLNIAQGWEMRVDLSQI